MRLRYIDDEIHALASGPTVIRNKRFRSAVRCRWFRGRAHTYAFWKIQGIVHQIQKGFPESESYRDNSRICAGCFSLPRRWKSRIPLGGIRMSWLMFAKIPVPRSPFQSRRASFPFPSRGSFPRPGGLRCGSYLCRVNMIDMARADDIVNRMKIIGGDVHATGITAARRKRNPQPADVSSTGSKSRQKNSCSSALEFRMESRRGSSIRADTDRDFVQNKTPAK